MSKKKFFLALLAASMLISVLASCENIPPLTSNTSVPEDINSLVEEVSGGEVLNNGRFTVATGEGKRFLFDADEEQAGTIISSAVEARNDFLFEHFGLEIITKPVKNDDIFSVLKSAETAGIPAADLLCFPAETISALAYEGLVQNLLSVPGFNIDASYYNSDLLKATTGNNSLYMVFDEATQYYGSSWAVFYDKELIAESGLEDPSILAASGKWTWSSFAFYAESIASAVMEKGSPDLKKDIFGFASYYPESELPLVMWESAGQPVFGDSYRKSVVLPTDIAGISATVETLESIYDSKCRFPSARSEATGAFASGRSVFLVAKLEYAASISDAKREWGLLPLPKMTESQAGYNTFIGSDAYAMAIPTPVADMDKSAALLGAICASSGAAMREAVYSNYVNLFLRNNSSTVLLETVMNSSYFDFASVYSGISKVSAASLDIIVDALAKNDALERPFADAARSFVPFSEEFFK